MSTRERPDVRLPATPKPWVNGAMTAMLRAPLLGRLLGRTFTVITVTGAVTGKRYSTPVQYLREDGRLLVLSQVHRTWWRNIRVRPEVELLLRRRTVRATAHVVEGVAARPVIARVFAAEPRVAAFYGVELDHEGRADPDAVAALTERLVVIAIDV